MLLRIAALIFAEAESHIHRRSINMVSAKETNCKGGKLSWSRCWTSMEGLAAVGSRGRSEVGHSVGAHRSEGGALLCMYFWERDWAVFSGVGSRVQGFRPASRQGFSALKAHRVLDDWWLRRGLLQGIWSPGRGLGVSVAQGYSNGALSLWMHGEKGWG
jgi:hypothetical protein